jgi:hypothetical protein
MGEYEPTIERLNKVLRENGFSEINFHGDLSRGNNGWISCAMVPIHFDKEGKFIKPENGVYA